MENTTVNTGSTTAYTGPSTTNTVTDTSNTEAVTTSDSSTQGNVNWRKWSSSDQLHSSNEDKT